MEVWKCGSVEATTRSSILPYLHTSTLYSLASSPIGNGTRPACPPAQKYERRIGLAGPGSDWREGIRGGSHRNMQEQTKRPGPEPRGVQPRTLLFAIRPGLSAQHP